MSRDALLARLARLDREDRAWLLAELPPEMRRKLMDGLTNDEAPAAAPPPAAPAGWESLDPQAVAGVLDAEPAWLVSGATRGCESKWRDKLLHHMTSRRRHEVELADRTARTLNTRAAALVLASCRERIAEGAATVSVPARVGFAALVDQMRSRFA